jgi:hypothetical protein
MAAHSFRLCVVVLSCGALSACLGRPVATYNWQFRQIGADATAQDQALTKCESKAKRGSREIRNDNLRIWSYVEALEFCMKQEGWESQGRPVTISYV